MHGGKRTGAGRKIGVQNKVNEALRKKVSVQVEREASRSQGLVGCIPFQGLRNCGVLVVNFTGTRQAILPMGIYNCMA